MRVFFRILDYLVIAFYGLGAIFGFVAAASKTGGETVVMGQAIQSALSFALLFAAAGMAMKWVTGYVASFLISALFVYVAYDKATSQYGLEPDLMVQVILYGGCFLHSLGRMLFVRPEEAKAQESPRKISVAPAVTTYTNARTIGWDEQGNYAQTLDSESCRAWITGLDRYLEELRLPSRHHNFHLSSIFYGHHHNLTPEEFLKTGYNRHFEPPRNGVIAPPVAQEAKELVGVAAEPAQSMHREPVVEDRITKIERLSKLKEAGHLSSEEFESEKRKILES